MTPIGEVTLAADETSLVGLWIDGQKYHGETLPDAPVRADEPATQATGRCSPTDASVRTDGLALLDRAKDWLDSYFAGGRPSAADLPLAPIGGAFRQGVWDILCAIPYGTTVTYGDIAKEMAFRMGRDKMSSQAVGGAVGHNPISIIIPCHRVVGSNGSLTGYAGGIWRKVRLLELEGVDTTALSIPTDGTAL
jgi:methylated-DNA-[protein]-cysteine S-methyltransferase